MAYFVAKTLRMKPNDILSTWSTPELIVAYGEYTNEITRKNHAEWANLDSKTRNQIPHPEKYSVRFHGVLNGSE